MKDTHSISLSALLNTYTINSRIEIDTLDGLCIFDGEAVDFDLSEGNPYLKYEVASISNKRKLGKDIITIYESDN